MKFLVDAQLPARLARQLDSAGHDAIHTLSLPDRNRTSDQEIASIADGDDRVVISKDRDFRDAYLLRKVPRRLLLVETGNVNNDDLMALFDKNLQSIVEALDGSPFVELTHDRLIVHGD